MDKLERLLNLTAALLHAEIPLTAEELRDRVGGYPDTKATFRRVRARQRRSAFHGHALASRARTRGRPPVDGYRLDRDEYAGTELAFEADELAALHLATSLVQLDGDDTALVKLGAGTGDAPADSVGRVPFNDTLATMIGAAVDRNALSFTYNDVERIVEPWKLSFTRGHWYLSGFDRLREDQRLYRADRIKDGVSLSGPAKAPVGDVNEPIDLRGWELGDGPVIKATILVDADQAAYARHMLGEVVDRPDGSVTATLNVRNIDAFRSFVLSFLEHAEILEPAELRTDFVEWLEAQR